MRNKIGFTPTFTLLALWVASLLVSAGASAASQDRPTVAQDSIQATAFTFGVYRGNSDTWSWVPQLSFRVNGPIASGSRLYAEFNIPGTPLKFDCPTEEMQAGYWRETQCGAVLVQIAETECTSASVYSTSCGEHRFPHAPYVRSGSHYHC